MTGDNQDDILWKRIENVSFSYSLSQVWKTNNKRKRLVLVLLILIIIWVALIVYYIMSNKLSMESDFTVFVPAVGAVIVLICPMILIFVLLEKLWFYAWIYSKWIDISWRSYLYTELKELKLFQYPKNWNEYLKFIYTKYDDRIITDDILYNPKMDAFLDKLQEILKNKWINYEVISDINNIDIHESVEYETNFWFFKVRRLLSRKERIHRVKNVMIFISRYLFLWGIIFISSLLWDEDTSFSEAIQQFPENFYSWLKVFLMLLVILVIFLTIHFILSVKKFYARIENNALYIHNWYGWKWPFLSNNYVLSKIKVNYWFIVEWNIEWIMLTIDDWEDAAIYKWPRNEKIEQFCSKISEEVRKRKKL